MFCFFAGMVAIMCPFTFPKEGDVLDYTAHFWCDVEHFFSW
jgi:hypothetical protein